MPSNCQSLPTGNLEWTTPRGYRNSCDMPEVTAAFDLMRIGGYHHCCWLAVAIADRRDKETIHRGG